MKKEWEKLTVQEQKSYEDKAEFLLDRGYVEDTTIEELAKKIYEKDG